MSMKLKPIDDLLAILEEKKDSLSLEELVELHQRLSKLEPLIYLAKNHIINALQSGYKINGYKLVKTRGRANISNPVEATRRLLDFVTNSDKLPIVLTPAPISVLNSTLGREVVGTLLNDIISSEGKGYDYAPLSDERPEVILQDMEEKQV